jgi:hypothetical protein
MDTPGYNSPQTRTTFVQVPVITIGGSITARLRANGVVVPQAVGNRAEQACLVTVSHSSGSYCAIQLKQASTNAVGTGSALGSQMAVVPGGTATAVVYPSLPFIDVVSVSGAGAVRLQMDSRIEWEQMAFAKTDTGVPPSLWKAQNVAAESSLPD